ADEAGLYRDALGAMPPGGLPDAFLQDVPDALRELVVRYSRTHGPFTTDELRGRYGVDAGAVLRELERAGDLVRGELRPGGGEVVWLGAGALGRSGRVALYFREDAPLIGPPAGGRAGASPPDGSEHELLRARLREGPCFFSDLLAELDAPAEALREALWDLV